MMRLGRYVREKKAASGMRPAEISRSTHLRTSRSTRSLIVLLSVQQACHTRSIFKTHDKDACKPDAQIKTVTNHNSGSRGNTLSGAPRNDWTATHSERSPSRKRARKATLRRPAASAEATRARRPATSPRALVSSSSPDRSLALCRQRSATCTCRDKGLIK